MNHVFKKENHFNSEISVKGERGFTIIELIISIFILTVAVVGVFSIFSMMVILTADAADKLTATYLAQEGLEIVSNIRDSNWLNMDACAADANCTSTYNWDDNFQNCAYGCTADYTTGTIVSGAYPVTQWTNIETGDYLYFDNTTGFYNNKTAGAKTKFKRKIIIEPVADAKGTADYILNVEVQVSWDQKPNILNPCPGVTCRASTCGESNCVKLDMTMYDWYNYGKNLPVSSSS